MNAQHIDAVVIGGGLHGLSAALHLARGGARVAVLERAWLGRHASGASAAGVRTLGRTLAELPLCLEAGAMWHKMEELVGDDCGFHASGQMRVAETDSEMAQLTRHVERLRLAGYEHEEIIGADDVQHLAPGISKRCIGATVVRSDGAADPHRTLRAFRRAAELEGVAIHEQCGVSAIRRAGDTWHLTTALGKFEAANIVNAAGAWGGQIAQMVGDNIPLGIKASMMLVTERVAPRTLPVITTVGRKLSLKQTDRGTLLIGGGAQGRSEPSRERAAVDFGALAETARAATDLFEWTRNVRIVRTWAGLEAKTADHLPVICRSTIAPSVVHVFGFSGHGFQPVPVVGAIVADLVLAGQTHRQIAAFGAERLMNRSRAA